MQAFTEEAQVPKIEASCTLSRDVVDMCKANIEAIDGAC